MKALAMIWKTGRLLACLAAVLAPLALATGQGTPSGDATPVLLAEIDGPIGPATAMHVERVIEEAEARAAPLVILRIDTPGGLVTAMRDIDSAILASQVPVAGYVAPEGARAASAGTYILYASHIAAMAPTTTLGAATPVSMGGAPGQPGGDAPPRPADPAPPSSEDAEEGSEETAKDTADEEGAPATPSNADAMRSKAINDAVATIRALAERRGRNADWAEKAVREAATLTATGALENNVIDLVAESVADLLTQIDGREIALSGGTTVTLATEGAAVEIVERSTVTQILEVLSNPNVALLLMTIGFYGIVFELANPGFGPGVVGAICLVLGLFALNTLPVDYAGLALIALGLTFMTVEALSPSFGVFGVGGILAFGFGASILVDTDLPAYQISPALIIALTLTSAAFFALVLRLIVRAQKGPARTGANALLGMEAVVLDWAEGRGHVRLHGERWNAEGPEALPEGTRTTVKAVDGLTVTLDPPKDTPS